MTRILFTTLPVTGHVRHAVPVVRELTSAGHEVAWYTGRLFEPIVKGAGAEFIPIGAKLSFDDAQTDALQSLAGRKGLAGLKRLVLDVILGSIPAYAADLESLLGTLDPDVIVADHTFMAGPLVAEKHGIPRVSFSTGPLSLASADTAPFGTGLRPSASRPGRLRNRSLYWVMSHIVLREARALAARIRAGMGLPPLEGVFLNWPALIADRYLQSSIPEFEYPRSDLPHSVEFVGATVAGGMDDWTPPPWWPRIAAAREEGRPVVFLTQGSAATDPVNLVQPALAALAGTGTLVVATTGGRDPETVLPAAHRAGNLLLSPFIPFTDILPLTDLMITNGGYGGVQTALTLGVPLVAVGTFEDHMEVNTRVAWSGAGVALRTDRPRPAQIARAVRTVLGDPAYRARARELADAYRLYPGASRAAAVVLEVAATRARVREQY